MELFYMPEWRRFLTAAKAFEAAYAAHGGAPFMTPTEAHAALEAAKKCSCRSKAYAARTALRAFLRSAELPIGLKAWPVTVSVSGALLKPKARAREVHELLLSSERSRRCASLNAR